MNQAGKPMGWKARVWGWLAGLLGAQLEHAPGGPAGPGRPEAIVSALQGEGGSDRAGIEKQLAKLGREQFKLNALLEAQQRQVQAALDQLREQDARREKEQAESQARRQTELLEARLQLVTRLLPVLDGLDEALAAGERLAARAPQADPAATHVVWPWPSALLERVWPGRARAGRQALASLDAELADWKAAQVAWLRGLTLVRERLLETFALEGVHPIAAAGHAFDPRLHAAVDTGPTGPSTPPGTVITELQRGYVAGARVLRYAQVVVARRPEPDGRGGTSNETQEEER